MAVSFVARKCSQCAGKLQYIKDKKIWKCLYCGAEIEREEQYDGLFTIKNVVRQALKDTAYRRLDSAAKNLIECEKIDSRYVGTLIAKISYEMICVTTPGGCDPKDAKGIFSQLKKNYELLKSISTSVTDEEEALYDFFDESDIFATLILVYDSLNDTGRRDFVVSLLNAKEVYSKPANSNLLTYALKNKKFDIANQIISNSENLDVKSATIEVLEKYPDGDDKSKALQNLFNTNTLKYSDKTIVEDYLSTSTDSVSMKACVLVLSLQHGIKIELERAMTLVISKSDCDDVKKAVSTYCKEKLTDEEIYTLLSFAYDCGDRNIAVCTLDCLKESNQYVLIPAKLIIAMLSSNTYSADDKVALLKNSFAFKIDNKSLEGIVTNYLCFNLDNADERQKIIECLFEKVTNFPTNMVESYVLKCAVDATKKPMIVSAIFDKGLNICFFNDLLSRYMNCNIDSKETKADVVDVLSKKGLKIDPSSLIEYICNSGDELPTKLTFIKKMLSNGTQLRSDAASAYLERTSPDNFSSELLSLIFTTTSSFSTKAVENYLLKDNEREAIKAANVKTIVNNASGCLSSVYQVSHLGNSISCNLLQAYILTTTDSQAVAMEIVNYFSSALKVKVNAEMIISGKSMKLKKYVVANKNNLSETTNLICESLKVFSMIL